MSNLINPSVTYTNTASKKHSGQRNANLDTITLHCYVAQVTAKQGCDMFATTDRDASCNFVVGYDGSKGLCVDINNRSWCSSSSENDNRAITIEIASDTVYPYSITDAAMQASIEMCADVINKNGLNFQDIRWTYHRDFAAKACPGDYIMEHMDYIKEQVSVLCGEDATVIPNPDTPGLYKVQLGAFKVKANAETYAGQIEALGYDTFVTQIGEYWKVQTGAFENKTNAENLKTQLKNDGLDAWVTFV